jgi:GNAT superfamily N-acetyltransferase
LTFDVHAATPARWPDLVDLFERRGPRGGSKLSPADGCWCMYWRDRSLPHGEPKKRALEALVRAGREPGLLAYAGSAAVAWVSVAPRDEFQAILRSPQYRPREAGGGSAVWSIVCLAVDPDYRSAGVAGELVDAAVAHALGHGATSIEAYPHITSRTDYMGSLELYRRRGFELVRPANKRAIVRRERDLVASRD